MYLWSDKRLVKFLDPNVPNEQFSIRIGRMSKLERKRDVGRSDRSVPDIGFVCSYNWELEIKATCELNTT